ncbi:hypothetical protein PENTCL1PPCAC_24497 [Pristionchus entomophagus]|uniref:Protein kinase domain-containing protein n=1 Tax=Pristionchus entomophagus TaxID=358040 RepID=A0AAV5U783_9BILA|nr:hypothetical protein PENTCL1PPCAC_24497 [Pristionchus entomophagus]
MVNWTMENGEWRMRRSPREELVADMAKIKNRLELLVDEVTTLLNNPDTCPITFIVPAHNLKDALVEARIIRKDKSLSANAANKLNAIIVKAEWLVGEVERGSKTLRSFEHPLTKATVPKYNMRIVNLQRALQELHTLPRQHNTTISLHHISVLHHTMEHMRRSFCKIEVARLFQQAASLTKELLAATAAAVKENAEQLEDELASIHTASLIDITDRDLLNRVRKLRLIAKGIENAYDSTCPYIRHVAPKPDLVAHLDKLLAEKNHAMQVHINELIHHANLAAEMQMIHDRANAKCSEILFEACIDRQTVLDKLVMHQKMIEDITTRLNDSVLGVDELRIKSELELSFITDLIKKIEDPPQLKHAILIIFPTGVKTSMMRIMKRSMENLPEKLDQLQMVVNQFTNDEKVLEIIYKNVINPDFAHHDDLDGIEKKKNDDLIEYFENSIAIFKTCYSEAKKALKDAEEPFNLLRKKVQDLLKQKPRLSVPAAYVDLEEARSVHEKIIKLQFEMSDPKHLAKQQDTYGEHVKADTDQMLELVVIMEKMLSDEIRNEETLIGSTKAMSDEMALLYEHICTTERVKNLESIRDHQFPVIEVQLQALKNVTRYAEKNRKFVHRSSAGLKSLVSKLKDYKQLLIESIKKIQTNKVEDISELLDELADNTANNPDLLLKLDDLEKQLINIGTHDIEEELEMIERLRDKALNIFSSKFRMYFKPIKNIGQGSFGCVFAAQHTMEETKYAIKRIPLKGSDEEVKKAKKEATFLASFKHQGIVRFYNSWIEKPPPGWQRDYDEMRLKILDSSELQSQDYFNYEDHVVFLYIQMELGKSNLGEWLSADKRRDPSKMQSWFSQIVSAVDYIHKHNTMHRDLKPSNILVVFLIL